ncbi:hypothetical protein LCGC14_3012440 [marine sediment metagenome]|uniref:Uncharacterized protein n=1 Tax=marine sediment metagenome TaxID=412755 RepID=A0A0F8ZNY6_9ZZZZ
MAQKTIASIVTRWTKEGPAVKINHFEHLSPVKIEKCFDAVLKEWYRLRAVSIGNRRKQEIEDRRKQEIEERAGAENG